MKSGIERADDVYVVITWIPLTTYPSLSTLFIVFLSGPDLGSESKTGVVDAVPSSCGSDAVGGSVRGLGVCSGVAYTLFKTCVFVR